MGPAKTCIGCRRRDARSAMQRLVERDGAVVLDPNERLPGRGAWIHRDQSCVETAIRRRAFGRALRVEGPLDVSALAEAGIANRGPTTEQAETPMDH